MSKGKETFFWIRGKLLKTKKFKGTSEKHKIHDLESNEYFWIPSWLVRNIRSGPGGEKLFVINDRYLGKAKLSPITSEHAQSLLALRGSRAA